jgi:hypothetical protein
MATLYAETCRHFSVFLSTISVSCLTVCTYRVILKHNGMANINCKNPSFSRLLLQVGARGGAVVEALRYKPEGRGIDSRCCHWNFSLT